MTSKIEQALSDATSIKKRATEDRQDYFKRLITAVQELPEDAWEALDTKAQKWVNDGANAANAKDEISEFPDAKADKEEKVTTKKGGEKNGKAASAKKDGEKVAEKKPAKKAAEKPAKKDAKPKGSGLEATIKNMIVKKPAITADELMEKLEAKSVKASRFTVVAIRAGFRHSIKVLQEAGLIKGQMEL